jgi:hypothetical protein
MYVIFSSLTGVLARSFIRLLRKEEHAEKKGKRRSNSNPEQNHPNIEEK